MYYIFKLFLEFLQWYVDSGDGSDKAGGYGTQSVGACLVKMIEGCFYNVMGLPTFDLIEHMKKIIKWTKNDIGINFFWLNNCFICACSRNLIIYQKFRQKNNTKLMWLPTSAFSIYEEMFHKVRWTLEQFLVNHGDRAWENIKAVNWTNWPTIVLPIFSEIGYWLACLENIKVDNLDSGLKFYRCLIFFSRKEP